MNILKNGNKRRAKTNHSRRRRGTNSQWKQRGVLTSTSLFFTFNFAFWWKILRKVVTDKWVLLAVVRRGERKKKKMNAMTNLSYELIFSLCKFDFDANEFIRPRHIPIDDAMKVKSQSLEFGLRGSNSWASPLDHFLSAFLVINSKRPTVWLLKMNEEMKNRLLYACGQFSASDLQMGIDGSDHHWPLAMSQSPSSSKWLNRKGQRRRRRRNWLA